MQKKKILVSTKYFTTEQYSFISWILNNRLTKLPEDTPMKKDE